MIERQSNQDIILNVRDLKKFFPIRQGFLRKVVNHVKAVNGVNFHISQGETMGLVGESGCGKTTVARCIPRLIEPTEGVMEYKLNGQLVDIASVDDEMLKEVRKDIQMTFQDPWSSLDPRMTVRNIIADPLMVNKIGNRKEQTNQVARALERVHLSSEIMFRYPHEFSGGQRQRISLARSLILNPKLVLCDEPVSALDVSVQSQVLKLLKELQSKLNLTYLFISHDLSVVDYVTDRVAVMYLGKIVETGLGDEVYNKPLHPYAEALMNSIPVADPLSSAKRIPLPGAVPDPSNPPAGCNFHPRCPYAIDICSKEEPVLEEYGEKHFSACHRSAELTLKGYLTRVSEQTV